MDAVQAAELAAWRRQVGELYAKVRAGGAGVAAWRSWQEGKQRLYREHPQSPVPAERRDGYQFSCFDHDPAMRVSAELAPIAPVHIDGHGDVPGRTQVGTLGFDLHGSACRLAVYWLDGYAGGIFVPFSDATSGSETYGGGRYVLDTAKGADLGAAGDAIVLDFNFAYAPSCAHDPRWHCPLAGPASRLPVPVKAGEIGP